MTHEDHWTFFPDDDARVFVNWNLGKPDPSDLCVASWVVFACMNDDWEPRSLWNWLEEYLLFGSPSNLPDRLS